MKLTRVVYGGWYGEGRKKGSSSHRNDGKRRVRRSIKKKFTRTLDRLDGSKRMGD